MNKLSDSQKEMALNFSCMTVKQRLECWENTFEFISKLPLETKEIRLKFLQKKEKNDSKI